MSRDRIFRVEYPTGHLEVNVGSFFGTADKARIRKLLRLSRQNCTDARRMELLSALEEEAERRRVALNELEVLRGAIYDQLALFFPAFAVPPHSCEKQLAKQYEKLKESIAQLKKERWRDDASLD